MFVNAMMLSVGAKDTTIPWQGADLSAAASTVVKNQSIILGDIQFFNIYTLGTGKVCSVLVIRFIQSHPYVSKFALYEIFLLEP